MFSEENLNDAIRRSTETPIIGALVWWQVDDLYIPRADLCDRLARQDIHPDNLIEIRARRALKRALREAEQKQMLRLVVDDEQRLVYAFIEESADLHRLDLDYTTTSVVVYDKRTQGIEFRLSTPGAGIEENFKKFLDGYTGFASGAAE